jgi:hypothetical protein
MMVQSPVTEAKLMEALYIQLEAGGNPTLIGEATTTWHIHTLSKVEN